MIPETVKDELVKKRLAGATWTELAKFLKDGHGIEVHRTTVMRWWEKEVSIENANPDDVSLDSVEDRIKLDKRLATYKAESNYYKKLYESSLKDTAKNNLFVDTVKKLAPSFDKVSLCKYNKPKGKAKGDSTQIVVAPLADTHIGENVDYQQMAGLNSYSFEVFNRRLSGWATQLLTLVSLRREAVPIDELVVPMLGDMISGDIHEELSNTNLDNCMQQMIRGANLIAQSLMFLAPHFKKMRVPCVVGNHGRMTRKPPMKDKYMDWDYMLYQWVAAFCREQKNIEFDIRKSYLNTFQVFNKNILIMHGDSASGAGSLTTITRVLTNLRSVLQYRKGLEPETGEVHNDLLDPNILPASFDSVMMGHFHRCDEIDIGTGHALICGCMKGGDEFALQRLSVITKPQQLVTYWHPKYGYIGKEFIYLNRYDTTESSFKDILPEVWINASS